MKPVARADGLVVRTVGDETLVYDTRSHLAHCLNRTASEVFRLCDGTRTVREIASSLAGGEADGCDEGTVTEALGLLVAAELLRDAPAPLTATDRNSRREALRRVGLGAALLAPIVTSLVVPTPAEAAATCIPQPACTAEKFGQPCYVLTQSECTSKECKGDGVCGSI
jgi:hypothetical protein